jgi:putative flippase GtrA
LSSSVTQPVKFVLVGACGYAVNLVAFAALFTLGVAYVAASLVAYFGSNALMYLGNRYFTFRLGNGGFWPAYLRYLLVGCIVAGLNAALLATLVEGAGADPRVGQALSLAALTPVAFVLNKRWTFQLRTT